MNLPVQFLVLLQPTQSVLKTQKCCDHSHNAQHPKEAQFTTDTPGGPKNIPLQNRTSLRFKVRYVTTTGNAPSQNNLNDSHYENSASCQGKLTLYSKTANKAFIILSFRHQSRWEHHITHCKQILQSTFYTSHAKIIAN